MKDESKEPQESSPAIEGLEIRLQPRQWDNNAFECAVIHYTDHGNRMAYGDTILMKTMASPDFPIPKPTAVLTRGALQNLCDQLYDLGFRANRQPAINLGEQRREMAVEQHLSDLRDVVRFMCRTR